ncbi:MAG: HAMP domain-containing histidine kinase [Deltaproteobacteria bacterium]|nr:HAMP domain-containing histidine kinase [Deltaproteobacteria bacterium]
MNLPTRLVFRLLAKRKGQVRALKEIQYIKGLFPFFSLFTLLIFLPALYLAYLALGSLQAEQTQADEELRHRAGQATLEIQQDLSAVFQHFEAATDARLRLGQSPLEELTDLSPYLRAAFRFDSDGVLAAPFVLEEREAPVTVPTVWTQAYSKGQSLELDGRPLEAVRWYRQAGAVSSQPRLIGEAGFAEARASLHGGRDREAMEQLQGLRAQWLRVRDRHGFRLGDLARLLQGEILIERDGYAGRRELKSLVEELLSSPWVVGQPGEAVIARRALSRLGGRADPMWSERAGRQLDERTVQLYWASQLREEIELFSGVQPRVNQGEYSYTSRVDSSSLWALTRWGDELYAFSFHQDDLLDGLRKITQSVDALDRDITLRLTDPRPQSLQDTLAHQSLHPWVPLVVSARPENPEDIQHRRMRQRTVRIAVLFVLVSMTAVGVVLSWQLLERELEGARIKADFAANVSHELRSPITQIRLKAETLLLDLVDGEQDRTDHYQAIVRESERLSHLVDNVLDFAAIERGAKKYSLRPQDLGEITRNTVEANRHSIESKGLEVSVDIPDDLPVVWADREAVAQVINNLLSNATKYGAGGGRVDVSVGVSEAGVEVTVTDYGAGIAEDDIDKIFDAFYRSNDPRVRRKKGTGIGLSIVTYIVEAHRGQINVTSTPDEGTSFVVTFPLDSPADAGA